MLILHGYDKLELNKQYTMRVRGPDEKYHVMTVIPIRESTFQEWKDNLIGQYKPNKPVGKYFYEVLTD